MKNLIFTLLLLCSASFSFAQVPSYVPANGLVGWWPFNGNANDESGNGNNGTVNGATLTTDRFGQVNKAYSFDGVNDFIEVNANSQFASSNMTISVWLKIPSNATQIQYLVLGTSSNSLWSCGYDGITGFGLFFLKNQGCSNYVAANYNTSNLPGTWNNITFITDQTNTVIYINGVFQNNYPSNSFSTNCLSYILNIGKDAFGTNEFFNGELDDIGIWNRALTQQEISTLYQGCNLNLSINPANATGNAGSNISFNASGATSYQWQTNPANNGWQNVNNNSTYGGAGTASLSVNNLQLQNHQQEFRVIGSTGNCADTTYSTISLADTCVTTVFDTITTFISVTDTLVINAVISSVNPPNNVNTLLIYPNPANTHITIDNGDFATMAGYSVRINNALGQLVFNQNITQQQFFIDLSTWTGPGLYYVNILDPNGNPIEVKKIVIQ
jgi:hypothetical protein